MKYEFNIIKGISPAVILRKELKERNFSQKKFAEMTGEFPSRINDILCERRTITLQQALSFDSVLGFDEGFFSSLQIYYQIKKYRKESDNVKPDLSKLSPNLFWDTDINSIEWQRMKNYVIERVLRYGTDQDQKIIGDFYGENLTNKSAALKARIGKSGIISHE